MEVIIMSRQSNVYFHIDYLMAPAMQERLNAAESIKDKVEFMFKLIEFSYNFDVQDINLIKSFYTKSTGEGSVPAIYITDDEKGLVYSYAEMFPEDITDIKNVLSGICNEISKEKTIDEVNLRMFNEGERRDREAREERQRLFEDIVFEDDSDNKNNNKERKSLDTIFAEIEGGDYHG